MKKIKGFSLLVETAGLGADLYYGARLSFRGGPEWSKIRGI
jgi:hypothetical protein